MSNSPRVAGRFQHKFMSAGRQVMHLVARWRNLIAVAGLLLSSLVVIAAYSAPTLAGQIKPRNVRHEGGFAYVAAVPSTPSRLYRFKDDWMSNPKASRLRFFEEGKSLGPAHSALVDVRQLGGGRYVHWGKEIWFSASDGTDPRTNGRAYEFQSKLSLKRSWATVGVISFAAALVMWMASVLDQIRRTLRLGRRILRNASVVWGPIALTFLRNSVAFLFATIKSSWHRYGILLIRAPILTMQAIGYLLLVGCTVFLVASIYALFAGWALPTAAPIRWLPLAGWAAEQEPILHLLLVLLAMLGATASWFSRALFRSTSALRRDEIVLVRFLRRWGIYLTIVLFVFSVSAIWAGHPRAGDLNWASIAGLIPFSDANSHFAASHDQAKDGSWSVFALRRPLAAAFRSSLMFVAGFSYANAVLLQVVLLACSAYAAARAITGWRGIYAGLAFFALSYVTVRTFLPTFLAEPLGLFWTFLSIPFLVAALRNSSLQHGFIGLAMFTVGLFMRPGAMFVIATLCLWLAWRFGQNLRERIWTAARAAAIVLSVVGASYLLQQAYGIGSNLAGSNFSYTLCGLSIGTNWTGCPDRYEEVKKLASEKLVTDFLYQKALENIAEQPTTILKRLHLSAVSFIMDVPALLWRGYSWWGSDYSILKLSFFGLSGFGLIYVAFRRREAGELLFWVLVWSGVVASAAFVYFDEGRRVMATSYPLLLMFFASGLLTASVPIHRVQLPNKLALHSWGGLLCAGFLFLTIPWLAHVTSPAQDLRRALAAPPQPNEHIVFGGRRITGILVVADDAELRTDVPTLRISRFTEFIRLSNVESYQGLLNPLAPEVPFGFIWAPRLESGVKSDFQYIVPAKVMQRSDVGVWKFKVREWNRKAPYGPYWFFVEKAEALQ